MKAEEIRELVVKYDISEVDGNLKVYMTNPVNKLDSDKIRSGKPEILEYLRNEKAQDQDREGRINAIEGLSEIRNCRWDWQKYNSESKNIMEYMMETGGASKRTAEKPECTVKELMERFPRAAAYLEAESISLKTNFEMSDIGAKALERIIYEDDYKTAIADMKKELDNLKSKHLWD